MHRLPFLAVLAAALLWAEPALAGELRLHSELKRVEDLDAALYEHTLNTMAGGYAAYSFGPGIVEYSGSMAAQGTGEMQPTNKKHSIKVSGTHTGGPCHDDDDCDEERSWSIEWSDIWYADTGLFVLRQQFVKAPLALECNKEKECEPNGELVKLVAGAKDLTLFNAVVKKSSLHGVFVRGQPAKNAREVSEIWWASPAGKRSAPKVAEKLAPILGKVPVKEWKWGGPPYDLIIIIGSKKGTSSARGPSSAPTR